MEAAEGLSLPLGKALKGGMIMYLNIGGDMAVRSSSIIGIFDLDNTSMSAKTREFLGNAERRARSCPVTICPNPLF